MLKSKLSFFSKRIQYHLFPLIRPMLQDTMLEKHRELLKALEVINIEQFIADNRCYRGRPLKSRSKIARAFIAKYFIGAPTTAHLIYLLKVDLNLKYICGWDPYESIPSESTFSRTFKELSDTDLLDKVHEKLVKDTFENHCVLHCGRDSMPIKVREREEREPMKKKGFVRYSKTAKKGKRITVCEFQSTEATSIDEMLSALPKGCNVGRKLNSCGHYIVWRGYKLHMDVAEGKFPISCILTSASSHDSQSGIPLSAISSSRTKVLYELMDSAYDVNAIRSYIESNDRIPLIKVHKRKGARKENEEAKQLASKTLRWRDAKDNRLKHRFCNERIFARLNDRFLGKSIWVRTHHKVKCHLMFGVLCLFASELIALLE